MICTHCGANVIEEDKYCKSCGAVRLEYFDPSSSSPAYTDAEQYYQEEFQKIKASEGTYKGRFNYAAFFLGPIWGFYKGLWSFSLISLIIAVALSKFVFIPIVIWSFYGVRGNYLYYRLKEHGEQFPNFKNLF